MNLLSVGAINGEEHSYSISAYKTVSVSSYLATDNVLQTRQSWPMPHAMPMGNNPVSVSRTLAAVQPRRCRGRRAGACPQIPGFEGTVPPSRVLGHRSRHMKCLERPRCDHRRRQLPQKPRLDLAARDSVRTVAPVSESSPSSTIHSSFTRSSSSTCTVPPIEHGAWSSA